MKSASLQYANALAEIAAEQDAVEAIGKQLAAFGSMYAESAELRNFLGSPAVTREAKHEVIEKLVLKIRANKFVRNFLFVLVDKRRTQLLPEIVAAFDEVIRRRQGVMEAQVSSAVELSGAQKAALASVLERITGKRVQARYALEPKLLGGAVVRLGDTVYDGSLRNRLNGLRARLAGE